MTKRHVMAAMAVLIAAATAFAAREPIEISVELKLDESVFVTGERIRGVVDVKNMSPDVVTVDGTKYDDRLVLEVYRSYGMVAIERTGDTPFVSPFRVKRNEGQLLETFVTDNFALSEGRYLVRAVLVHGSVRYEGEYKVFDIVPGIVATRALQMFSNRKGLNRRFDIVRTQRRGVEHFFLKAADEGLRSKTWQTTDIGPGMKYSVPTVSILPTGEVIVIHRADQDSFYRSEFWSTPDALEFRSREALKDPDSAGQSNVQEMYRKTGGVKAAPRPWWKFW